MTAMRLGLLSRADVLSQLLMQFFSAYTKLLQSENYVTRRQSLKVRT